MKRRHADLRGMPTGRPTWRSSCIGHPVRSCWTRGRLWTVPDLWKTHRTRFPQLLGRRTERAAHNGPQAFFFLFETRKRTRPTTMTLVTQGG